MKKRKCRMTAEEKRVHDFAVSVRKMKDKQLCDFVNGKRAATVAVSDVLKFIMRLEQQNVPGIGPATVRKIKEFAAKEGFISGENDGGGTTTTPAKAR